MSKLWGDAGHGGKIGGSEMVALDLEELKARLDKVPCKPRLYPARLFALQVLTAKKIDELIDARIIQPLSKITEFAGPKIRYRFTPETLNPMTETKGSATYAHHFISDLGTYGLREAILYFNDYEFTGNPDTLVADAIALYHEVARSYVENEKKLKASKDETIKRMMMVVKLYGEGSPQQIKTR